MKRQLAKPPPHEPRGTHDVCNELAELILPYGTGNTHPRFWGWVHGTGTAGGMLAEMAAAAMNANCGGRNHGAIHVERCVVDWMAQWFGLPKDTAGGLLTAAVRWRTCSGLRRRGSARVKNVRRAGSTARASPAMCRARRIPASARPSSCLGSAATPCAAFASTSNFAIDLDRLRAEVKQDRADGFAPFCVVATAGTVNTGASDDLAALADFCRGEELWLHVDGAFGALTVLCPELAPRLAGIELADSLAFDFHKWLHVPYDAGCLLVRDESNVARDFRRPRALS